ncbi:hypothetical protein HPB52_005929 [Rhipicephalus sanguineus]|uniref:Transposable element P transposase-like RNase H domain-containing protein n=1 Tax=Rhipicephalus sanguineus TaxID=34632 RepID=A0A9D4PBQ8_RHISA|nr:hypothetical protein HPB52_005929 [Rhipicephalus sanguineus]
MKCGFDKDFFSALKKKLQTKPTFFRHGMLLLDEMHVRQCKRLNSRTLSYEGLVDQGEQNMKSKDLADHALVFMFCPFTDSYAQPVAVFASKNAMRGIVLCQLLLQTIVLLEEAGAFIDGVVYDGASTNRTMWKHLGISERLLGSVYSEGENVMKKKCNLKSYLHSRIVSATQERLVLNVVAVCAG